MHKMEQLASSRMWLQYGAPIVVVASPVKGGQRIEVLPAASALVLHMMWLGPRAQREHTAIAVSWEMQEQESHDAIEEAGSRLRLLHWAVERNGSVGLHSVQPHFELL